MGVAFISWGRFNQKNGGRITMPAPPTDPKSPWFYDWLAGLCRELRQAGFSAIQLPPVSKAQGGAGAGCDGYGVFDPRDLGSKSQQGSVNTRYGSAESLRRLIGIAHAVGMDVYLDVVMHQLMGENGGPGIFRYLGADGKTLNGRGAMNPGCFRGNTGNNDPVPPFRPEDAVPVPFFDYPFGREKVYQNCDPPGFTTKDALDYGNWIFTTTDADGMRFDDTKGTWAPFVSQFMRSGVMAGKFAYSEYFDGNPASLNWWATSAPMDSRSLVEDFTLHFALQTACDGGGASGLGNPGYIAWNPFLACTFVDNPDTDTTDGQQVISNKGLAYAYLLSAPGYPFVYAKDYFPNSVLPGAYGLKPLIDNLVWIHENLAFGDAVCRYVDNSVVVLNRTGYPGLLTALNFDTYNIRTITCATSFGANVQLHDYTGRHPDIWTDGNGSATFTIPSNAYNRGESFLCFSREGYTQPFAINPRTTTQVFYGADDLDIPAVHPGGSVNVSKIYCAADTAIEMNFHADVAGSYSVAVTDPAGKSVAVKSAGAGPTFKASAPAGAHGWFTLQVNAAATNPKVSPFKLGVTYRAPQTI